MEELWLFQNMLAFTVDVKIKLFMAVWPRSEGDLFSYRRFDCALGVISATDVFLSTILPRKQPYKKTPNELKITSASKQFAFIPWTNSLQNFNLVNLRKVKIEWAMPEQLGEF